MMLVLSFNFYNLVPNLTAKENVELASEIVSDALDPEAVLKEVGLGNRLDNFPAQLSGGEQQRVAIARAVAKNPKSSFVMSDGSLDYQTGKQVLGILQDMSRKKGATVIIVTHNAALAPIADRVIRMHDAKVKSVEINDFLKILLHWSIRRGGSMKRKVYWKDLFASFTHSKGRFLSILTLMLLGSLALVGLKVTTPKYAPNG